MFKAPHDDYLVFPRVVHPAFYRDVLCVGSDIPLAW